MEDTLTILKKELYLYVDLECCGCSKLVALSNMAHYGKHYYCRQCEEKRNMAEPTKKDQYIEALINLVNPSGRTRVESIKANICAWCGKPATEFRDELSRREYTISGFCQECQDKTFDKCSII